MSEQGSQANGETSQINKEAAAQHREINGETKSQQQLISQQKSEAKHLQSQAQERQSKSQQIIIQTIKKQNQIIKDKRQKTDKVDNMVQLTQKQFKKMMKLANQVENYKAQYEKLVKNYEIVRAEKDQFKQTIQQKNSKIQNLANEIQQLKNDQFFLKQQTQKYKRDNQVLIKKVDDLKKTQQLKEGLQQKVRQLEIIIDMTTKSAEQHKKAEDKLRKEEERQRQFLKIEKESNSSLRNQVERLRVIQSETFIMKQELVRISTQYKNLKLQKQQLPIMIDKFQHQEQIISQLKDKIKEYQVVVGQAKSINQKLQKRITQIIEDKKQLERNYNKSRCQIEQTLGECQALKSQLQDERGQWQVQKKRYLTELKTLKTQLHNQHEKLKITEWELSESRKKEKPKVQMQRVNILALSKDDLLNYLEEMEMKNQSLKLNLNEISHAIHEKDKVIKEQGSAIMALTRQITRDYPNFNESEGMDYVEKEIIDIGRQKKEDWAEIVEKVMIQNMRLKYSVTALGEQYNHQLRKDKEK